ncbi:hypothetical protein MA9V2_161 [Chryseobacterium phage MA9V-2]|nr:hypothetical protein MA9V2_161 [Chryseobacterium phage MA9V-2]
MTFTITFQRNERNYIITSCRKTYKYLANGHYGLYNPRPNNQIILVDRNKLECKTEIGVLIWYRKLERLLNFYESSANITSLRFDINNDNYVKLSMDTELLRYIKPNDDYSYIDVIHAMARQTLPKDNPIVYSLNKNNPSFFKMLPREFMKLLKAEFDHKFPGFICEIFKCWEGQHYELQSRLFAETVAGLDIARSNGYKAAWKWANDADRAFRKYFGFSELLVFSEISINIRAVERYESLA